jgi:hypothetical protein
MPHTPPTTDSDTSTSTVPAASAFGRTAANVARGRRQSSAMAASAQNS